MDLSKNSMDKRSRIPLFDYYIKKTILFCTPNAMPMVASILKPNFILGPKNHEPKLSIIASKVTPIQCCLGHIIFEFPTVFLFELKNMLP